MKAACWRSLSGSVLYLGLVATFLVPPTAKAQDVVGSPKSVAAEPKTYVSAGAAAKEIGNQGGGSPFRQAPGNGSLLVGCEVTLAPFGNTMIIKSIRPIFENSDGSPRTDGQLQGIASQLPARVEAKPNYAVARIVGMAGDRIDAFYVVFMRRRGDHLDPADSYASRWFGARTSNPLKEVGDLHDRAAIGLSGRSGDDVDAISLIFE